MHFRRTARIGFTLIELLVVVAIIALLISILLPSLNRARQQAKLTTCGAQLKDIGNSMATYTVDYLTLPQQNTIGSVPTTEEMQQQQFNRSERVGPGFWGLKVHEALAAHLGGLEWNRERTELTKVHPVFYCPFVDLEDMDPHANQVAGPFTLNGITATEDQYLHITYTYAGRLDECLNDPAEWTRIATGTDNSLRLHVLEKRADAARKDLDARYVLMSDSVVAWKGGGQWRINHGTGWGISIAEFPPRVDSANTLYGDGHVERKNADHFRELNEAQRPVDAWHNATVATTAVRADGWQGDVLWW
jgi:prepilin-type N-terminal cleavage/methylation domain-containing protein/prepilin-type processing-associated H-X9-DG protein